MEGGSGFTPAHDMSHTRPADVLVQNWVGGKPAAFDFTVTSPLTPKTLGQSSICSGFAAELAETRKHHAEQQCLSVLSLVGVIFPSVAVETYGNWGKEAVNTFALLACRIAIDSGYARSKVAHDLYSRMNLNIVLTRSIARAILVRGLGL